MKGDLIKDFHDLLVASTFKTSKVDYLISFLNVLFIQTRLLISIG